MDYQTDKTSSRFIFNNPNITRNVVVVNHLIFELHFNLLDF